MKLKPWQFKVRILSYTELEQMGFIYEELLGKLIVYRNGVWKTLDPSIFKETEIIIPSDKYLISLEDYEYFRAMFEVL